VKDVLRSIEMSVTRQALRRITRAGAYSVYFVVMNVFLAANMLIEMSWLFLHPGNVTSSGDWFSGTDVYLRNWFGLPPRAKKAKEQEPDMNEVIDSGEPDYLWSENAHWILSVYEPWERGDGYSEEVVREAEAVIGTQLPELLRSFYRSWGRREEMIGYRDYLILPDARLVFPDAVVIAVENQGTIYWSILRNSLADSNPSVYSAEIDWSDGTDTPNIGPWRLSHEHVSDFLDGLILGHAFVKGAVHGAHAYTLLSRSVQYEVVASRKYPEKEISSTPWRGITGDTERRWSVFVGDGIIIDCSWSLSVAANSAGKIDEVADLLQVSWQDRW
jgi:hypothetical protein